METGNGVVDASIGSDLVDRCMSGEVIVVREFLQQVALFDLLRVLFLDAARSLSPEIIKRLEPRGLERLHELLSITQVLSFVRQADARLRTIVPTLYGRVLRRGMAELGPVWVLSRPIARVHIPFDCTQSSKRAVETFRVKYGVGRVTTLRPHRDIWFTEPLNCFNIWIPLTRVVSGNGISFYPDEFRKALSFVESTGVTCDQAISSPVSAELSAGDALMFSATQLHASEINTTALTRVALTLRISVEEPQLTSKRPGRYRRVHSRWPWSFQSLNARDSIAKPVAQRLNELPDWGSQPPPTASMRVPDNPREESCTVPEVRCDRVRVAELETGRPLPISARHMLIKIEKDGETEIWKMDRRCPHQHADLSLGHVNGQVIRCPWHNLPIDITTGRSPCRTLDTLKVHQCTVRGGRVDLGD